MAFAAVALAAIFFPAPRAQADDPSPGDANPAWSGFHAGASLGEKWSRNTWNTSAVTNFGTPITLDGTQQRNFDLDTFRIGGFLGYDYQFAPLWVTGIEFDVASADQSKPTAGVPGCTINCAFTPGPSTDTTTVRSKWDASARLRLGYLVTPRALLYGTAGMAWENIQATAFCIHYGPSPSCVGVAGSPSATSTDNAIRTGWTIGAGVDYRLSSSWILRGEYRYSNFGTANETLDLSSPTSAAGVILRLKSTMQIATVGVAYEFGGLGIAP